MIPYVHSGVDDAVANSFRDDNARVVVVPSPARAAANATDAAANAHIATNAARAISRARAR